jgi:hypothetical protein
MGNPFIFMTSVESAQLTGHKAANLLELYLYLKEAEGSSLYYHTHRFYRSYSFLGPAHRSDFALWVAGNLKEEALAERMAALDLRDYRTLEDLRGSLLACMEPLMEDKERWTRRVLPGLEFHFCKAVSLVLPSGYRARNLEEFVFALERVDVSCIYYHLIEAPLHYHGPEKTYAGDFSRWLADAGFPGLAQALDGIDPYQDDLETVRARLLALFQKNRLKAAAQRVLERVAPHPSGQPAADWLRRWRKEE